MASKPVVDRFIDDISEVLARYADANQGILTVAEMVGALELVKMDVVLAHRDRGEESDPEVPE